MSTKIRRSMAATVMTCTFALTGLGHMNTAQAEETTMHGDHQVSGSDSGGDHGPDRGAGAFGGAILAVGLLSNLVNHASMKDSDTHYRKDCITIGNFKVSITSDPSAPLPPPKLEIRKKAPRPIRHVTDKRTSWTYYLAQDRNTGETFIQIEDADGNDMHINGSVPMPGGGPTFPVR